MSHYAGGGAGNGNFTGSRPWPSDAERSGGMHAELEAHARDYPYGPREGRCPYDEPPVTASSRRAPGCTAAPDALDGLIELARALNPEDWLGRLQGRC